MRGDGVGVGDIIALHDRTWCGWDSACGNDGRRAPGKWICSILGGHHDIEHDTGIEQGGDRIDVVDGAWGGVWSAGDHRNGAVWSDGMRGHGVGVGDIGELHEKPRSSWDTEFDADSGREGGQHEPGMDSSHVADESQ